MVFGEAGSSKFFDEEACVDVCGSEEADSFEVTGLFGVEFGSNCHVVLM